MSAELYYDDQCGPCTLWARAVRALSRGRITLHPLASPRADVALADLPDGERFGYAHLSLSDRRWQGEELLGPLLAVLLGPRGGVFASSRLPSGRLLRRVYRAFWEYRRTKGCAAAAVPGPTHHPGSADADRGSRRRSPPAAAPAFPGGAGGVPSPLWRTA